VVIKKVNTATRRHHYRRIKKKRKWYWGGPVGTEVGVRYRHTEKGRLGMLASTPHPCSCIGCSNLRRICGPPRQERRAPTMYEWWDDLKEDIYTFDDGQPASL